MYNDNYHIVENYVFTKKNLSGAKKAFTLKADYGHNRNAPNRENNAYKKAFFRNKF